MAWLVEFEAGFADEVDRLPIEVRRALFARTILLRDVGPQLGRPHADHLNGSKFSNMKELRFEAGGGVWRVAYAFDPLRTGILLVAGDKSGVSESRFYRNLIAKADQRFERHLESRE